MINIFLDGTPHQVPEGTTILTASGLVGVDIPHFCFHPAFEPEGSCRMCLVEIEGLPKLELACAVMVKEGMKVSTSSLKVVEARKEVLELLLADHPLDCPICDKAGECQLQVYYGLYGLHESRFVEDKERKDKKIRIGKTLILDRERCILCTRCVRFLRNVTKSGELGVFKRGIHSEIGIHEGRPILNNYSANLVDVCPVGAITDADFRFKTRTWFLERRKSVCPQCGRGCNIFIEFIRGYPLRESGPRIMRIKASENPQVNGSWICDIGRYRYQEIGHDRRLRIRANPGGEEREKNIDWDQAVKRVAKKIQNLFKAGKGSRIAVVLSASLTNEEFEFCRILFADALEIRKIHVVDPKDGEADGFLLTEDRVPNRRGAVNAAFSPAPLNLDALGASSDLLFIFGPHLLDHFEFDVLKSALGRIGTTILLSAHRNRLDALADMIFPVALTSEKSGSFTNVDGLRQTFEAALDPRGDSLPEGEILKRLAEELGVKLD